MTAKTAMAIILVALGLLLVPRLHASRHALSTPDTSSLEKPGTQQALSSQQRKGFLSPGVISASDAQYPLDTTADGIVVFDVSLSAGGEIANIRALTDIPPLTTVAESSLRSWKFMPASSEGMTIPSHMLVAFAFRHAVKEWNPPVFNPVFVPGDHMGYAPIGILSAKYAEYPSSTIASGATVVQLAVSADGVISNAKAVRAVKGGFAPLAMTAAQSWKFKPATFNGTPVASKVAIAFVFSSRALNPF